MPDTKLSAETNAILTFDGNERFIVTDDPTGTPTDGYTTQAALAASMDWQLVTATWTRTGDHTFTLVGDVTATYAPGVKVRYKDGGAFEYGVIGASSYSAPNTTVTLITNSDYAMAAATITDTYLSRAAMPIGFPDWFNWVPAIGGFSSAPTGGIYRWRASGRDLFADIRQPNAGTSNAADFNFSAPIAASTITNMGWRGYCSFVDNNATSTTTGALVILSASPTSISAYTSASPASGWTASSNKRVIYGSISYEFG
jgi:hypothetical protein